MSNKNAGMVYIEVAKKYFEQWYPDMKKKEKDAIFSRRDFDEIESYIHAKEYIEAAIDGIEYEFLHIWGCTLPDGYTNHILFNDQLSKHGRKVLQSLRGTLAYAAPELHDSMVLSALITVHKYWVTHNTDKFFDPERADRQYMFMPLLYIGWEETKKDLIFVEPIADHLGLSLYKIERYYYNLAGSVKTDKKTLIERISCGKEFYTILNDSISDTLKREPAICDRIADQIIMRTGKIKN